MDIINYLINVKNIKISNDQLTAINNIDDDILLLAVPGSGKTTTMVVRILNLIINHKINPNNIMNLTFSRASALDMKNRYTNMFNNISIPIPPINISTIHSLCYNILNNNYRSKMPKIISENPEIKYKLLNKVFYDIYKYNPTKELMEKLFNDISYCKNMMYDNNQVKNFCSEITLFQKFFYSYEKIKKIHNYIDYDDLIIKVIYLLDTKPNIINLYRNIYKFINIDEVQDISKSQHELIRKLKYKNTIFMVGDEDQSIYSFRGASPESILDFNKNYPTGIIIKMSQNFRSTQNIISYANNLISNNIYRYKKQMSATNNITCKIGIKIIKLNDFNKQYKFILKLIKNIGFSKTIGIIYRNNESAIPIINMLYQNNVDFNVKQRNYSFFNSVTVNIFINCIKLSINSSDITAINQLKYKFNIPEILINNINDLYLKNKNINIFTEIIALKNCPIVLKNCIINYQSYISKLKFKSPINAIMSIEKFLGYKDNDIVSEDTKFKINILKSIAKCCNKITDFIDHFLKIDNIINQPNINNLENANIFLTTIHSSKGLEFDHVILVDMIDNIIPTKSSINEYQYGNILPMEEQRRLFYVAITRAKYSITIFKSFKMNKIKVLPTRFIKNNIPSDYSYSINPINKNCESYVNRFIFHKFYGKGIIKEQTTNEILVLFDLIGYRKLTIPYCITQNLISFN